MPWTSPPTFVTGQIVTATDLNSYMRDNTNYLLIRPRSVIKRDNNANYSTTSLSFVDVDATNLIHTITINGSAILVGFAGAIDSSTSATRVSLDVLVDGTRYASGGADGAVFATPPGANGAGGHNASFSILITGLAAGSHILKLQWKASAAATVYMAAGNGGAAPQDMTPSFWAVEVG